MKSKLENQRGIRSFAIVTVGLLLSLGLSSTSAAEMAPTKTPRIVNIYNFIRNSDYRVENSEEVLLETTRQQIDLIKPTGMPVTWALQYDALINPKYQALMKEKIGPADEIAAWWEIPRPLAEKAGLEWRGHHDWDSTANIGFSPGYTPEDRRKLVDVYMAEFKSVFGTYPQTVGSWYIDEVTLEYMVRNYGIVASCNCKDQVGTDGYTLWGGYWNQAYYPSRLNAYMPAQTKAAQIDVPIFRMLGSDPIYQYWQRPGMYTLEPVYPESGASEKWVNWFMKGLIKYPALGFGYTQAGQENSFGWKAMEKGLTMQIKLLKQQAAAGEIQIMTLAEAGKWFKGRFPVTPPTSIVYLDDWRNEGRKTVWYNSRFYRMNLLWEETAFSIRDIHRFDENVRSVTHDAPLSTSSLAYGTLPIMDASQWSGKEKSGIWPVLLSSDGVLTPMAPEGPPVVKELDDLSLSISQPLTVGGAFHVVCRESKVICTGLDAQGKPLPWAWEMVGGDHLKSLVNEVSEKRVGFSSDELAVQWDFVMATGTFHPMEDGRIRILPNRSGEVTFTLGKP